MRACSVLIPALAPVIALAGVCLVGCSAERDSEPVPPPARLRLDASVAQFRFDEGTRNLKAGVTNNGAQGIRVSRATIAWDGFAFPTVPVRGGVVQPGQTAAFTIAYGEPQCDQPPTARPTLVAVVDGRTLRLPLRVEDPQLLDRLRTKACAQQRLGEVATVDLRLERRTVMVRGEEHVPGDVVVERRPGATVRVRVVDLGGSVLLDLVPRGGRDALPGELGAGRETLSFPVLLGSAHRCDQHALGQSSQTFLVSAYVRLDGQPPLREILGLDADERDRLLAVVARDCG
jgi:hypothetical protein